jgi:multicomponent Na+:H+ antiporter subunit D
MNWPIVPILLPLLTGLAVVFMSRPSPRRRALVAASALAQLALALWLLAQTWDGRLLVLPMGGWSASVGIMLVIDLFSAIMLSLSALIALASILYGYAETRIGIEHPLRLPLIQFLVTGINLTFCTGDLFNLFVAFEVMLIASYALLTNEADDWDIKQAYPYVALNLVGSTLFICAAGLAYGLFGTLNFAGIASVSGGMADDARVLVLALLLMVVFGIKSGIFPLYFWLPNSYPTLPFPLAALFAGMMTKVGVYVMLRVFGSVLPHDLYGVHLLLAWLAALTMVIAIVGAISRNFIRGILALNIASHVGFMVLAIGLFTPLSCAAAIFYMVHHIVVIASLFLFAGVAFCLNGTDHLDRVGNLWKRAPWLGVLFLFQGLSLAGIPPLSGFWGKYVIVVVGLEQRQFVLVGATILASLLTLYSMLKIWNTAFWSEAEAVPVRLDDPRWSRMTWVVAGLTALSIGIGLGAEGFMQLATRAAEGVLDQDGYAAAVLGAAAKGAPAP